MLSRTSLRAGNQLLRMQPVSVARVSCFSTSRTVLSAPSQASQDAEAELLATVKAGIKEAMKAKDTLTSTVLRSIVSEHQYSGKQKGNQVSKVSKLITKAIARRKDTAKQFRAAKPPREDLAEQEEKEAAILEKFLPKN
ncbi:hypothetical protein BCV70DRAFT_201530 [Testicularia cyperi]|uniref:Altered inheritance of mitochondria protein 41 n=1 Tax=Testicularia cyperi TaxID=1882483 RepID=A0A317XN61_9BASI|nr:hypothetical protein BCV70DRAFT_201530 [Testicularia cyperi]